MKRLLSLLLAAVLTVGLLPAQAFASIADLAGNTPEKNESILQQLQDYSSGDGSAEEASALLKNLGLLDADGNLAVDQSIELDGKEMSLKDAITMLDKDGTDLTQVAYVDGTPVSLGDLKTMIEIEQELADIKDKFFSDRTFTKEGLTNLNSLLGQMQNEGIQMLGTNNTYTGGTAILDLSDANIVSKDESQALSLFTNGTVSVDPSLLLWDLKTEKSDVYNISFKVPAGCTPSFKYRYDAGQLKDMVSVSIAAHDITDGVSSTNIAASQQAANGNISVVINPNTRTTEATYELELTIKYGPVTDGLSTKFPEYCGLLSSFIQFFDPQGIIFSDGTDYFDRYHLNVNVNKEYIYLSTGTSLDFTWPWMISYDTNTRNIDTDSSVVAPLRCYMQTHWAWPILYGTTRAEAGQLNIGDYYYPSVYKAVLKTAQEISDYPSYKFSVSICTARDQTVDKALYGDVMLRAYPTYTDMKAGTKPFTPQNDSSTVQIPVYTPAYALEYIASLEYLKDEEIVTTNDDTKGYLPAFLKNITVPESDATYWAYNDCNTTYNPISIYDTQKPTLTGVSAPAGTYVSGEYVPITLTFSELVQPGGMTISINGKDYTTDSALNEFSFKENGTDYRRKGSTTQVYWYKVQDVDNPTITVTKVSGIKDLCGNVSDDNAEANIKTYALTNAKLTSTLMKNAVTSATASYDETSKTATITLALNQAEAYRTAYSNYDTTKTVAPFTAEIRDSSGAVVSGGEAVPFTLKESTEGTTTTISAEATYEIGPDVSEKVYTVGIKAHEKDSSGADTASRVLNVSSDFTVPAMVFVNGLSITYPEKDTAALTLSGKYRPTFGLTFTGTPTYKTGTWTSSDKDIATIEENGAVRLTGTKLGDVSFTFTADNGGKTDSESTHVKSVTSKTYTVTAGSSPALVIPENSSSVVTKLGESATVIWSSNSKYFTQADFKFTVELFKGNYADEAALKNAAVTPLFRDNQVANTAMSYVISKGNLTELSVNSAPAYTVRVSMPHPNISTETLSAIAHIFVNPQPAVAKLTRFPDSNYMTDKKTMTISWAIDNYVPVTTESSFEIRKVTGDSAYDSIKSGAINAASGSYPFTPNPVDQLALKDTYMVMLQVRNSDSEAWSTDSFPIYVYREGALQIETADGTKLGNSITMDNTSKVSNLPTATNDILALRQELALIEYVGINYKDYSWSQLKDGIQWATSDDDKVSVNYKQGGLYEDIKLYDNLDTYLPETKMALSSVTDGTATITATHANTGMSDSVQVNVKTLRDQFYLFQITPALKTTLTYTDGKGKKKSVVTNDEGVLALYEPDGIASDVSMKSKSGDKTYLGTYYQSLLRSGERDATKLQLYPLNTVALREVAKVNLYLKNENGASYTGGVTIRGGVYKNGGYCQVAEIGTSTEALQKGDTDLTATLSDAEPLTLYYDSTQFWSSEKGETLANAANLSSADRLTYVLEIRFADDAYAPLLLRVNGNLLPSNIVYTADNTINLQKTATGEANKPFTASQTLSYGSSSAEFDVLGKTDYVGPTSTYPVVTLKTTALLWGAADSDKYEVRIADQYGKIPDCQTSSVKKYPFATMRYVENVMTLSKATMTDSGWLKNVADVGLKIRILKNSLLMKESSESFRIADLTNIQKVTESADLKNAVADMKGATAALASTETETPGGTDEKSDKIRAAVVKLIGDYDEGPINGPNFKVLITPTDKVTVFNAMIWAGYEGVGLDDMEYNDEGIALSADYLQGSAEVGMPTVNDLVDMGKGEYDIDKSIKEAKEAMKGKKGTTSVDIGAELTGYYKAEIRYNIAKQKWEVFTTGGGFTAAGSLEASFTINAMAGPVPLTATFKAGGAIMLKFDSAVRYKASTGLEWADTTKTHVSDFLTTLRLRFYLEAFGGIGVDYSVVALKIGLFGSLSVDGECKFLSRPYLKDKNLQQLNGQGIVDKGTIGIKFVASLISLTYEYVFVSGSINLNWQSESLKGINDYWANTGSGLNGLSLLGSAQSDTGYSMAYSSATLISRDYLKEYARTGGSRARKGLLGASALPAETLGNANPTSYPLINQDGSLKIFVNDMGSTSAYGSRVCSTTGSIDINAKSEITLDGFSGYGDSSASLAGISGFSAAAWVRSATKLDKEAGDTVTAEEQNLLLNGSEIVAAVYDGTSWKTTRITNNSVPDLAPVVATNGKSGNEAKAIVAWRSVYAADATELMTFGASDQILYKVYSNNTWGDTKQLYNGTSGAVKGIKAAMLSNGTAAVAYTLDRSESTETAYTMIDISGNVGKSMIATNDKYGDENPQIAAVKVAVDDERFVIGWYSDRDGTGDVRLLAVDSAGTISNSFPESISAISANGTASIGSKFTFAKMDSTHNGIENLTILWDEKATVTDAAGNDVTDHSIVKAVRFRKDGDKIALTAPQEMTTLPERTLLDSDDAYIGDGAVNMVLQGTYYDKTENELIGGIKVPKEKVNLYTASGSFTNSIDISAIGVDYENLALNTLTPIQFTVYNGGIENISKISIKLDSSTQEFSNLNLAPNGETTVTCSYNTGDEIVNPDYTVTATFASGIRTATGKVHLDYPDVGIAKMETISEDAGTRTVRVSLYNASPAVLAGSGRTVKFGLYDDESHETIQSITCSTEGVTVDKEAKTLSISGANALQLLDAGALTLEFTYDLGAYITTSLHKTEIPEDSGVTFYARVWAEEKENGGELPEYVTGDNNASILFDSPIKRAGGEKVSMDIEQGTDSSGTSPVTTATIKLRNNSLQGQSNPGSLIATLLSSSGEVLEEKQATVGGEGALAEESEKEEKLTFTKQGARVNVTYGILSNDVGNNSTLTALQFEGLPVTLNDFTNDGLGNYTLAEPIETDVLSTLVSFVAAKGTTVTINGQTVTGSTKLSIPSGTSEIVIKVTGSNKTSTYTLKLKNGASGGAVVYSSVSWKRLAGANRYDTAAAIANEAFPDGAKEAVLVSGANFPDALSASGYAGAKNIPILLTAKAALSEQTKNVIKTLGITKVTIIGGTASVSQQVEKDLKAAGVAFDRIEGANRRITAEKVYAKGKEEGVFTSSSACVIVSGAKAADALSMSSWSYAYGMPVLLADGKGMLSAQSLEIAKSCSRIYIAGGDGSVSGTVESSLDGKTVKRLAGANRYETSAKIAEEFISEYKGSYHRTAYASGKDNSFADALAGSMLCGINKAPILLVDGMTGAGFTLTETFQSKGVSMLYFLGGEPSMPKGTTVSKILSNWNVATEKS